MYGFLNRNGMGSPYLDEARALSLLAKAGIAIPKSYRTSVPTPVVSTKPTTIVSPDTGKQQRTPEALQALRRTVRQRLPYRLARLLPEGDTPAGVARVKKILRAGGFEGPGWNDEPRALAIFKEAGISIEGFEYASTGAVSKNHPIQLAPRVGAPIIVDVVDDKAREIQRAIQRAIILLDMYEEQLMAQIRKGAIAKLLSPLELPIAALNELRPKLKTG